MQFAWRSWHMAATFMAVSVWLALAGLPGYGAAQQQTINLNPNFTTFPECSLVDRSGTLEAPAGKHGFLTVRDGRFVIEDGTRARFFGVNLAKDAVFVDKPTIDQLADLFARAGINMVRIHHIDDQQGILDPDPARYFRPDQLDCVDYWIAKLKEKGIYVCLDLNDYRTFRASEGVENGEALGRGAKPYAVFDQRLMELQQDYARRFLVGHVNPYTKLTYANDPAVAMLEIYDENGLFIRRGDLPTLKEPYKTELQRQWNAWLRQRYGNTELLRARWTDANGYCALMPDENLGDATVRFPLLNLRLDLEQKPTDPLQAPARVADGTLFAYDTQISYFSAMMDYLRKIGVRIPITAVGAQEIIPDSMAISAVTDYIGINYYWDHPAFDAGKPWVMPAYFSLKNPFTGSHDYSFPATVSLARMHNKPLVVRELGYCFPNPYRGAGMIDAAAYGAFLDVDALILFTFGANKESRTIGFFDIHKDPLRWGLVSQAARLFLSGEVQPATHAVGIGYSPVDAFTWHQYQSDLYPLSFATRVVNYTDMGTPHPFNLLVSSGRSGASMWLGKHLLLFANNRHTDLSFQATVNGLDERHGYGILTGRGGVFDFTFRGIGYDQGVVKQAQAWPAYSLEDLTSKGLLPVATSETAAMGLIDPERKVIAFRNLRHDLAARVALDALRDWHGATVSHQDVDRNLWRADTGQIERDIANGLLRVDTPTMQAITGRLTPTTAPLRTSAVQLSTATAIGTLTVESLDKQPLEKSARLLAKMTSRARNDRIDMETTPNGPKQFRMRVLGAPPILTDGEASTTPTRVEIGGKLLIEIYVKEGTWEYLVEADRARLFLDTGPISISLPEKPRRVLMHTAGETMEFTPLDATMTIPAGVRLTEIIWER